jgi:tRNA threonylcarbamoyladenosine biosynthesis protein TsaE
MKFTSPNLSETERIASDFVSKLMTSTTATVLALQGDLGAGKTAFSQAVGKTVGVRENMHSPTFVIEKIYEINFRGFKKLIHIDAYRLEKDAEIIHIGWNEIIKEPENLILIEWPENVSGVIPENAYKISFQFLDENTRKIEIHES